MHRLLLLFVCLAGWRVAWRASTNTHIICAMNEQILEYRRYTTDCCCGVYAPNNALEKSIPVFFARLSCLLLNITHFAAVPL